MVVRHFRKIDRIDHLGRQGVGPRMRNQADHVARQRILFLDVQHFHLHLNGTLPVQLAGCRALDTTELSVLVDQTHLVFTQFNHLKIMLAQRCPLLEQDIGIGMFELRHRQGIHLDSDTAKQVVNVKLR